MASEFRMEIALSGAQDMGVCKVRALPSEGFKEGMNLAFFLGVPQLQEALGPKPAALHSEDPGSCFASQLG